MLSTQAASPSELTARYSFAGPVTAPPIWCRWICENGEAGWERCGDNLVKQRAPSHEPICPMPRAVQALDAVLQAASSGWAFPSSKSRIISIR